MSGIKVSLPKGQWRVGKDGKLQRVKKRLPPPAQYAKDNRKKWKAAAK